MTTSVENLQSQVKALQQTIEKKDKTISELKGKLAAADSDSSKTELKNQLQLIRTLFDVIPNPVFYKNTKGIYLGCNQSFARLILGIDREKIIGCSLYDLPEQIPLKLADVYRVQDEKLFSNPGLQIYETKVKCSDGEIRDFLFYKTTYNDTDGKVAGLLGLMLDITAQNKAQIALRESEEKYRSMMESMADAVYICSPENKIQYVNPQMIKKIGYDATGEICHKVLHDLDEPCLWCSFDAIRSGKKTEAEVTSPRDGKTYLVTSSPIFHQDGTISKMTIYHDITRRRQMEQELLQAKKLEATGLFAGGIAHDYNNLLFIILGNLLLMKKHLPPATEGYKLLESAEDAAHKSAELIKRLLAFTHGEPLNVEKISLADLLQEVQAGLEGRNKYSFQTEFGDNLFRVIVDSNLMSIALNNIVDNACEAMPDGGVISIKAENAVVGAENSMNETDKKLLQKGQYVRLTITDQGEGIDEAILPNIFDPYFSTKERGTIKGQGFGLSTSYSIMMKHRGSLTALSEAGKGTTMEMYIPAAAD